jgi:hypothetical protein
LPPPPPYELSYDPPLLPPYDPYELYELPPPVLADWLWRDCICVDLEVVLRPE